MGEPWFLGYLLSDATCLRLLGILAAGFFTAIIAGAILLSFLDACDTSLWDLEDLAEPVRTLHYSMRGVLRAWDGRIEFLRGSSCVGIVHDGVVRISWSGDKTNRDLSVYYADGTSETFCCGPMGWQEAVKSGSIVMRYAGRHAYG